MSAETDELLRAYEPLPTTEKQVFVREILHRLPTVDVRELGDSILLIKASANLD